MPSKRERLAQWRFVLQLKVLHRMGRYREVLQLGRAYFDGRVIEPSPLVARMVVVMAQSTERLRRPAEARELYGEVLEVYKALRSKEGVADALLGLANTQLLDCQWDEADALYQESRFRYEEIGQSDKALSCLLNLGVLRAKRGDLAGGRALLVQASIRASQMGESRRMGTIRLGLALVDMREGRVRDAMAHLLAVLQDARTRRAPRNRALAFEFLGELHLSQGRTGRARVCLASGLKLARQMSPTGDLVFEIRRRQAETALAEGSLDEARVLALESVRLAREYGDVYEAAVAERVLAICDEQAGRSSEALRRVRAACDNLDRLGETYERARFELLKLRLELLLGQTTADRVTQRAAEVERPYEMSPNAVVRDEAARLCEAVERVAAKLAQERGAPFEERARSVSGRPSPAAANVRPRTSVDLPSLQDGDRALAISLGLVGESRIFTDLLRAAVEAAETDLPIVIIGEAGAGKSRLARFLHMRSRRPGNFLSLRVADLNEHVVRAELFGGAIGSPFSLPPRDRSHGVRSGMAGLTLADGVRPAGLFAAAARGTLCFEAMGEVAPIFQVRMVEWLERAGEWASPQERPRYLFAARQPVREEWAHILGARILRIPSLRSRAIDIPVLAQQFATDLCERYGLDRIGLPTAMLQEWSQLEWPANLTGLRQAVEAFVLKRGDGPEA